MSAEALVNVFLLLGFLFLIGLATDVLGQMTQLPRVTLLLLFGFAIGPSGLALLPDPGLAWSEIVSTIALVMVGFLLGGHLTAKTLRQHGTVVLSVSLTVTITTMILVAAGLMLLGVSYPLALLLGAMATATAPAATVDVIHESGARGPFTSTLLGVVAIDDVWGLLSFSLVLTAVNAAVADQSTLTALSHGLRDLGGAVAIGVGLGIPMSLLTGRIRRGEPTQAEALGFVFLCAGLALWLEASFILAAIVLGMTVANLAQHHKRAFHEIEGIEWPFLILFFVLAGASLDMEATMTGGAVLIAYLMLRTAGRLAGGWLGGRLAGAPPSQRRWFGAALLPQAGVAIGMALIAAQRFPAYADDLLTIAVAATVVFELLGPIFTRQAILRQGEASSSRSE